MLIINRLERNFLVMNKDQTLQLLGLIRRANALITGEELVVGAIRNKKAKLVLLASDAGKNTTKKISDKAQFYEITVIRDFTREQLSNATGMARSVYAVTNPGFAKKILQKN
ncbi:hypothetical protein EFS54_00160 [Periweissella beninensis]|uniref:Ribosomal L7Ae/L30e/S12e/Gadd45 family protein n=2 Tax=Periweissella beninensis TaxID=504936 RepID=A0ABT0VFX5_9LACO|nr:ribosomal L7Ae/L30e/S12e/Gadd45 family protein [Periweissella beninensis]MCT4395440.1 hypothetical protein [Periweissella beninensis]